MNHPRMDPVEVQDRMRRARVHLEFVVKLHPSQLESGARFLHEHPAWASSWQEPSMVELLAQPGVGCVVGHMCRFGMRAPVGVARGKGGL
eukprot:9396454-Alexandrium_andersonii.AAC.1